MPRTAIPLLVLALLGASSLCAQDGFERWADPTPVFYLRSMLAGSRGKTAILADFEQVESTVKMVGDRATARVRGLLKTEVLIYGDVPEAGIPVDFEYHPADVRQGIRDVLRCDLRRDAYLFLVLPLGCRDATQAESFYQIPKKHRRLFCEAVEFVKAHPEPAEDKDRDALRQLIVDSDNPFLICSVGEWIGPEAAFQEFLNLTSPKLKGEFLHLVVNRMLRRVSFGEVYPGQLAPGEGSEYLRRVIHAVQNIEDLSAVVLVLDDFVHSTAFRRSRGLLKEAGQTIEKEKKDLLAKHQGSWCAKKLPEVIARINGGDEGRPEDHKK
jgi:hypothetical protein